MISLPLKINLSFTFIIEGISTSLILPLSVIVAVISPELCLNLVLVFEDLEDIRFRIRLFVKNHR